MNPETEVIACPACKHLVRVPLDWLGTQVQCPECRAQFRAPIRENGTLTGAELLSRPGPAPGPAPAPRPDLMLMLPAFGLLVCGVVGAVVNGYLLFLVFGDPAAGRQWAAKQTEAVRKMGLEAAPGGTPEEKAAREAEATEQLLGHFRWILPTALAASATVLAGGLAIVFRRNYRLAQLACVVATLNVAHLCCVPGAVAGLWGLLMLGSEEGRAHFRR
ncbi:hypothetical protein GobsT_07760 [Gemmata obscuriglobus]|uniref:hypothetical protein n=1 Tax=Gemmata obscuriglobus TaxID=114 RepID=UPI0011CD1838|nr:hypothetical protein [Gemmata obscuriglobus]QEG26041.1 hypothetical protein GobsT_07760 [Gemmata obscuriglobus]VTS00406.1 unnamed protein product [Gemmata obscuriglobus UQM 2246]